MFDVMGMRPVLMGKLRYIYLSASSGFRELSPYKQNRFASYYNTNELSNSKICILYCETILVSILQDILCYQNTLTMNYDEVLMFWCDCNEQDRP